MSAEYRVSWKRTAWRETTWPHRKVFSTLAAALRFVEKLRADEPKYGPLAFVRIDRRAVARWLPWGDG
ncbi:MAG: hypothetical protein M3Q48_14685 [Actinomycetota bacterium]|nr:hypothetical protein [Actinomycetota bacterium]